MTSVQSTDSVLNYADMKRQSMSKTLLKKQKLGQYFSSAPLARLMASMMDYPQKEIRILDPGAGIGSLFVACAEKICKRKQLPRKIAVTAYEVDSILFDSLNDSLEHVRNLCHRHGLEFSGNLEKKDFIEDYSLGNAPSGFTHVIMNPPYKKINVSSQAYKALRGVGLQTTNMYAAFIAISHNMLGDGGQIVFISPRSFCNGSYFYRFRRSFLESMSLRHIHLFNSRTSSFRDDGVLQENVIIHAEKHGHRKTLVVSSSQGPQDHAKKRRVRISDTVFSDDPQYFIHIVPDKTKAQVSDMIRGLECTLEDLDMSISTGKVVDFRIRDELRPCVADGVVPLVRPFNISRGTVAFPMQGRKHHNFIMESAKSRRLLVENGNYVVVKRFTATEEKKRVVAAVWSKKEYRSRFVGFENRTNYFHRRGGELEPQIAKGLWAFLNSTIVDSYFRQFNGNTQVNATDLRYLRYPSTDRLKLLGNAACECHNQEDIDNAVREILFGGMNH